MQRSSSPRLVLTLSALALAACQSPATAVRVTVTFGESLGLDQIGLEAAPEGESARQARVPDPPAALQSGLRVVLLVPDAWAGRELLIKVKGTASGTEAASGEGRTTPLREQVVDLTVALSAACRDECPLGDKLCFGEAFGTCGTSAAGCSRWSAATPCPSATPFCANGTCDVACKDECGSGQRRCVGTGYQVCGEHDSDGCTEWGPILACGASDLCDKGACIPSCGGKPCPCQDGETSACADVGECHGGTRTCKGGQFGPCQWTAGPSPEKCDGKDNDCDGRIDNNLPPQPCEKQAGVCKGARKSCGGAAGWLPCGEAEYRAVAAADYELVESKCDGKDNDCNGLVDEPAACKSSQGTWAKIPSPASKTLEAVWCSAKDDVWVTGAEGVYHYDGSGWKLSSSTPHTGIWGRAGEVWAVNASKNISHYKGGSWSTMPLPVGYMEKVRGAASTGSVYAVGSGGQITMNVSGSWLGPVNGGVGYLYGVYALDDESEVWAVGGTTLTEGDVVRRSQGWSPVSPTGKYLYGVWGSSKDDYWVVGDQGTIQHWTKSGGWLSIWGPTASTLNAIWGGSASDLWAVGAGGAIIHYASGSWTATAPSPTANNLRDVWGGADGHVFAVGEFGTIVHYQP